MESLKLLLEESCSEALRNILSTEEFLVTADAKEADAIIFQAHDYQYIKGHDLFQEFREKCFVLSQTDFPEFFLPGIYSSNYRHFFPVLTTGRTKTYSYFYVDKNSKNQYIDHYKREHLKKKYLFSFVGGSTSHLRRKLFRIYAEQSSENFLVQESRNYNHWDSKANSEVERKKSQQDYVKIIKKSYFCLCPRGAGHSSIRLFEAMELGVCPVVIADRWIPPKGLKWEEFSVFIREKDVGKLEEILSSQRDRAILMGLKARAAFEEYFSDEACPQKIHDLLSSLINDRKELQEDLIHCFFPVLYNSSKAYNSSTQAIKRLFILLSSRV